MVNAGEKEAVPQKELSNQEKSLYYPRQQYLDLLRRNISHRKHTLLLAPRGMGKSMLVRQFFEAEKKDKSAALNRTFVYLDLARVSISPENFTQEFIGSVAHAVQRAKDTELLKYQDIDFLLQQNISADVKEILASIRNELQKIKPDQRLILTQAFACAEQLAKGYNKQLVIALDDAEELLGFDNYPQIRDSVQLFADATKKSSSVSYLLVSSFTSVMRKRFSQTLEVITLEALSAKETHQLAEKIVGKMDERVAVQLHHWCAGIPSVTVALAEKLVQAHINVKDVVSVQKIREVFAQEIASPESQIYRYAKEEFFIALTHARGASLLKSIVRVVALHDNLRLTEIARKVYRSGPVTKSLLDRLGEVDLIKKVNSTFEFHSPIVKNWCKTTAVC
ncbi:ATP-binding protein [Candidatus Woesearchaeota archaeon]|nr:ATP-binding protein [Candidatus Woesearchaeota archaeon]